MTILHQLSMHLWKSGVYSLLIATLTVGALPLQAFAVDTGNGADAATDFQFYSSNDILYYDANSSAACGTAGGSAGAPIGGPLPAATLQQIKAINLDGMLAKTKERYVYGEQQTKVPWQMLAAIHYREGQMNPSRSMLDGSGLGGTSMDGFQTGSNGNDDAKRAALHLIEMAKSVYKIDITTDRSLEGIAKAFLSYNRGFLYVRAGATYNTSPYVMNGFDDAHMNMSWGPGDTVSGRDMNLGALTVYSYLTGPGANATGATDNSGCTSGAVASTTCSATKPYYGASGGNGHQLTASELTSFYGAPGTQDPNDLVTVDFLGKNVRVHKKVAGCLGAVINEIQTKNIQYNIKEIGAFRTEVGGGNVANGSSYHQYGIAIDINWTDNPCCSVASYTMPQGYIDAFKNHGWSWGGDWRTLKDYMHFEFNGQPEESTQP